MTLQLRQREGRIPVTRPNWSDAVSVRYEFLTGIISSYHDYEQRQSMRLRPRVSIEYTAVLTTAMLQRWFADMTDPNAVFWVACEWRKSRLSADAPAGSLSVTLDSLPIWIATGVRLVMSNSTSEEVVTVSGTSGGNTVSFDGPTEFSYQTGDRLYLALSARADEGTEFNMATDTVFEGSVRFECVPGETEILVGGDGIPEFEDEPVLTTKPNWRGRPSVVTNFMRETFDPGRGQTLVFAPIERLKRIMKFSFTSLSTTAVDRIISLFLDRRGKQRSFWVPTWVRDLTPKATASSGQPDVVVAGTDFRTVYEDSDIHNVMVAWDTDGSHQANRIASMADDGTDTTVTFTDNWSFDITPETKVSFLYRARFAADILETRYLTDSTAEIELSFEPIRNDA